MASFKKALAVVLDLEGTAAKPYDNDRNDSGNWIGEETVLQGGKWVKVVVAKIGVGIVAGTKWGVTAIEVAKMLGKRLVTAEDVKNFPMEKVEEFYMIRWNEIRGDEIKDEEIATDIFQFGVNSGMTNSVKKWQRAQNLPETGKMDDLTLQNINE